MWIKKKSVLVADHHYDTEKSATRGWDWRAGGIGSTFPVSQNLPSVADAGKYFYLPALGWYRNGQLMYVGSDGYYWSSSAYPQSDVAYYLGISSTGFSVNAPSRELGMRVDWPK